MFNAEKPSLDALPTSAQLLRSTIVALLTAAAILVTIVLPAECGIDPTGAGRLMGLAEMGAIKQQLADKAEQGQQLDGGSDDRSDLIDSLFGPFVGAAHAQETWRDEVRITLAPDKVAEIKLVMQEGDAAQYAWVAAGGRINFDLHAHGGGQSVTYEKGSGATGGEGGILAPFAGEHGWFWRNRDKEPVSMTLQLRGDCSETVQSD